MMHFIVFRFQPACINIIAEVISNNVKFSDFYNSVITLRIAEELSLNLNETYIGIVLISGIIFSIFLTLFFTPFFYKVFDKN